MLHNLMVDKYKILHKLMVINGSYKSGPPFIILGTYLIFCGIRIKLYVFRTSTFDVEK